MRYIPLTQNRQAIVDDEDYPRLIKYKWQYHSGYAKRGVNSIRMARVILNAPKGLEVDHINGDKLDNRKTNLRLCTRAENVRNVTKRKDTENIYKGIHFLRNRNKWIARIQVNGKRSNSGYFNTPEEAAERYNKLAKKYFGRFASLNYPIDRN